MVNRGLLTLTTFFMVLLPLSLYAGELSMHGRGQVNNSFRLNEKGEHPGSLVAEQGVQLEIQNSNESGSAELFVKTDMWNDNIEGKGIVDIREAFAVYTQGPFDFTIGRQIITWGIGDRIFVSDVFPKDWAAFYTGRPMEYMKLPSSGIKLDYYNDLADMELVWLPIFEPDRQPYPERFILKGMGTKTPEIEKIDGDLGDSEIAIRVMKGIRETTCALHIYHGFWRQYDKGIKNNGTLFYYPRLNVYSLTLQRALYGGIISIEGGYYDSIDEKGDKDNFIEKSQWRYLIGFEQEILQDLVAGVQYYGEYLNTTDDDIDRKKDLATLSLKQSLLSQTLNLSLWGMFDIGERDYFIKIETGYSITDEFGLSVGGNILGAGTGNGFFGQLDKNDTLYFNAVYRF